MKAEYPGAAAPALRLEDFLAGHTRAWGIFQDRFGRLRQQFIGHIEGVWDADNRTLTLDETFTYQGGRREHRTWTLEKVGADDYRVHAADLVGVGSGRVAGSTVRLAYRMRLTLGGRAWRVKLDEAMFRQDDHVVIDRVRVSKWGIALGTATMVLVKPAAPWAETGAEEAGRRGAASPPEAP